MSTFWDWWAGALALGIITFAYGQFAGRRFGISSAWERVLHWRQEREAERLNDAASQDDDAFAAALAAATAVQFGETASATSGGGTDVLERVEVSPKAPENPATPASTPPPQNVATQAFLLGGVLIGAVLAAVISGRFAVRGDMGPDFADLVVDGPLMWPTLFVGGLMVGFGTRMAGGCSSGHGLSGCSRLQPVSILATAVFFGTAALVSTLLWKVI